jgi:hypothetical protein
MKRKVYFSFIIVALSFVTVKTIQKAGVNQYHYLKNLLPKQLGIVDFNHPNVVIRLPFELRNIEHPTGVSENQISFISSSNAKIYSYNTSDLSYQSWEILHQKDRTLGLCFLDSSYFVLGNDLKIARNYLLSDTLNAEKAFNLNFGISTVVNGYCSDPRMNRLLLCEKINQENAESAGFGVYALDFHTKKIEEQPLVLIDPEQLDAFAKSMELDQRTGKKLAMSSQLNFVPCSMSVNPISDELFVLSSDNHTIAVFSKEGKLKTLYQLNKLKLKCPSELTFLNDGDLIIVDKGEMGVTKLLKFNWLNYSHNEADKT